MDKKYDPAKQPKVKPQPSTKYPAWKRPGQTSSTVRG